MLILKRSYSIPKQVWREAATRRTPPPLVLDPLVEQALSAWTPAGEAALIEADVQPGGGGLRGLAVRAAREEDASGVFTLSFAGDNIRLRLSQKACRREVCVPRRSSRHLAILELWQPLRLILNGKADWPGGRFYFVQDYHVLLCDPTPPDCLPEVRTFDLQADLL